MIQECRKTSARALKEGLERFGQSSPFWIVGPCVVEGRENLRTIAEKVKIIGERNQIPIVFKASLDKANRTSHKSFRSIGFEPALRELEWVKKEFSLPILTDVHETKQVSAVAEIADILQIPAFLSRQTDLIEAAAKSERLINVKKGQFMAPSNAKQLVEKLDAFRASGYWITERGVSFGYGRLVVDFSGFPEIEKTGAHLVMDVTHAVQLPSAVDGVSGGVREAVPYLARAAAAVGVFGFFAETHPDPQNALSDGLNAWPLHQLESLMCDVKRISEVSHG